MRSSIPKPDISFWFSFPFWFFFRLKSESNCFGFQEKMIFCKNQKSKKNKVSSWRMDNLLGFIPDANRHAAIKKSQMTIFPFPRTSTSNYQIFQTYGIVECESSILGVPVTSSLFQFISCFHQFKSFVFLVVFQGFDFDSHKPMSMKTQDQMESKSFLLFHQCNFVGHASWSYVPRDQSF